LGHKEDFPVTHLRQLMLDELERRNYSPNTVRSYLHAVEEFARHFRRSPQQLGPDHVREYQVHLFRDRKLSARTIAGQTAALRFLFVKTLRRPYLPDALPFPKHSRRLPTVLHRLKLALDDRMLQKGTKNPNRTNLRMRLIVLIAVSTGMRSAEIHRLLWSDVKYSEGLIAVRAKLKKGKERYVPMAPELAAEIRRYPAVIDEE
jgi:site-specific recombinase XerD